MIITGIGSFIIATTCILTKNVKGQINGGIILLLALMETWMWIKLLGGC